MVDRSGNDLHDVYPDSVHSVALAVSDQISLLEIATPCEVFGVDRSELADPWYDFIVCGPMTARIGTWFRPWAIHGLGELSTADTVLVPASHDIQSTPTGELVDAVRAAYDACARVVSIGTGVFVLAAAGLLDGRRVATHWLYADVLAEKYPRVRVDPEVLYVDDGTVLTSAGDASSMDLCLHIVAIDHGAAVANAVARHLVMPPPRAGSQAQFVTRPAGNGQHDLLATLQSWMAENLDQPLAVADLARRVNMSTRSLTRRFNAAVGVTPMQWMLTQRIRRAQELLETTNDSIEYIAGQTGMGTAATLRRNFNRTVGIPPDTYRRTFRNGSRAIPDHCSSRTLGS